MTLWSDVPFAADGGRGFDEGDEWTISLLTNPEVIAVDQHSTGNHPVIVKDDSLVWLAEAPAKGEFYLAVFNRGAAAQKFEYSWSALGLKGMSYLQRDLWERKDRGAAAGLSIELPAHASVLYLLKPQAPNMY